jgi:tubulin--tyrosine ligase
MYRYFLNPTKSPTYWNLAQVLQEQGWSKTRFSWRAHFGEQQFEFNSKACECLEFKDALAQLVSRFCPDAMPLTFSIDDETWPLVLEEIARESGVWILKPAQLNNGQHIKIFEHWQQIYAHYLNQNRMGGPHVLQRYLTKPHLIKGPHEGHKYSLRLFVVLTNFAGVYLYPQGYYNVALLPYAPTYANLRLHLTNEHLEEGVPNVVQIPTVQYADLFAPLYPRIKTIVTQVVQGLQQSYPQAFVAQSHPALAFFGFDFVVDETERVWLIEANHGPCFPVHEEHPLQQKFYKAFWQKVVTHFVLPIAENQKSLHPQGFDQLI